MSHLMLLIAAAGGSSFGPRCPSSLFALLIDNLAEQHCNGKRMHKYIDSKICSHMYLYTYTVIQLYICPYLSMYAPVWFCMFSMYYFHVHMHLYVYIYTYVQVFWDDEFWDVFVYVYVDDPWCCKTDTLCIDNVGLDVVSQVLSWCKNIVRKCVHMVFLRRLCDISRTWLTLHVCGVLMVFVWLHREMFGITRQGVE